jgi:hypothetical protein
MNVVMGMARWKTRLAQFGILGRCILLALVLGIALVVAAPLGFFLTGSDGAWAAIAAALVVWVASTAALALGEVFQGPGPNAALFKLLFGMTLRMALPLAACMAVHLSASSLDAAGFVFYVLGFYLLALPIDTLLSVTAIAPKPTAQ